MWNHKSLVYNITIHCRQNREDSEKNTQDNLISIFENFKDFISKFNVAKLHLLKFIKCKLE